MLFWCLCFLLVHGISEAGFTEQPADTTVIQGDTATLKCTVVLNTPNAVLSWLYWSKGNKHLSINETILPDAGDDVKARYSISGNRTKGEYYLKIVSVKKFDEGSFHCSYISSTGGETSVSAKLTVLVPPERGYPKCNVHPANDAGDASTNWPGQGVVFTCFSRGGDPAAQLSWHRGNHSILEPRTSRITYERILKREDNGVTFTCKATSPALLTPRFCYVTPMKIHPIVEVRSMSGQVKKGENSTFHCEGSAIPRVHKYKWFASASTNPIEDNEKFTLSNGNQVLTVHDVDYVDDRMEIRCEVNIKTGLKASGSIRVDVAKPPPPPPPPKIVTKKPTDKTKQTKDDRTHHITDIRKIITMDVNFIVAIIAGSLVLLLLVVAMIMGCWVCSSTKPRRPNTLPRIEYTETVPTTIPQGYSMDGLNYQTLYGDTSCAETNTKTALENENAPGYISALYATLDKNKRPIRTSVAVNIPGKPIAQITPTTSCDGAGPSEHSCCVKPEKVVPEPVKISPLVGKVVAMEPVKPVAKVDAAEAVKPSDVKAAVAVKPAAKVAVTEPVKPVVKPVIKPVIKPVVKPAKPESSSDSTSNQNSETTTNTNTESTNVEQQDNKSDDGTDVDANKGKKL